MTLCVQRPSDALDVADVAERIRRDGGGGWCTVASGLPPRSPGSRTLCGGTGAAGAQASAGAAGQRGCPTWLSPPSYHDGWRRSPRRRAGRRVDRSTCGASRRACRDPSDWGLLPPPKGALTVTLSSDCQRHWMLRNSWYRVSSLAHSCSKAPAWTHSWKRRWHVEPGSYSRGKAFHWQPVRRTNSTPSMTWRKGTTGRPGVPGGFFGREQGPQFGPQIVGEAPDGAETSLRLLLRFHRRQPLLR